MAHGHANPVTSLGHRHLPNHPLAFHPHRPPAFAWATLHRSRYHRRHSCPHYSQQFLKTVDERSRFVVIFIRAPPSNSSLGVLNRGDRRDKIARSTRGLQRNRMLNKPWKRQGNREAKVGRCLLQREDACTGSGLGAYVN